MYRIETITKILASKFSNNWDTLPMKKYSCDPKLSNENHKHSELARNLQIIKNQKFLKLSKKEKQSKTDG